MYGKTTVSYTSAVSLNITCSCAAYFLMCSGPAGQMAVILRSDMAEGRRLACAEKYCLLAAFAHSPDKSN